MTVFRDDLLNGGVRDNMYISITEPNIIYRVSGLKQLELDKGSDNPWVVERISYSFNGQEKPAQAPTKSLIECLLDERLDSANIPLSLRKLDHVNAIR